MGEPVFSTVAYAVPAYQSGLLLTTLFLAGAVLGEFDGIAPVSLVAFYIGCFSVVFGILLNSWGMHRSSKRETDAKSANAMAGWDDEALGVAPGDVDAAAAARRAAAAKFDD